MMRRKNLERAIVLGLLLSTSVYGNAWADEYYKDGLDIKQEGNLVITKNAVALGFNGKVEIVNGDLIITANGGGSNGIEAGQVNDAVLSVSANNINITSGNNGLITVTEGSNHADIILGSEDRKITGLTINAGGQGIDNKNGNVYVYGADDSVINISSINTSGEMENQAAINNNADKGTITINGGSITLSTMYGFGNGITNGVSIKEIGSMKKIDVYDSTTLIETNEVTINASVDGVRNFKGSTTLDTNGSNEITATENAVYAYAKDSDIFIVVPLGNAKVEDSVNAVINIRATKNENTNKSIEGKEYNNILSGGQNGIRSDSLGTTNIIANDKNKVNGNVNGIYTTEKGVINLEAGVSNIINNNVVSDKNKGYGSKYAVNATKGTVNFKAGIENSIYGAVYATGDDKNGGGVVNIGKLKGTTNNFRRIGNGAVSNNVYSAAVIEGAGDLAGKTQIDNPDPNGDKFTGMDVVSALYAEEGANINLSGINNIQTYYGDAEDEHTSERAVWAYKGADITIDGTTNISTYAYNISPENRDIAIAAGTATELTDKDFTDTALEEVQKNLATVNLKYQAGSSISGDILAAYGGEVKITDNNVATRSAARSGAATGINITGDLLAGNTGKLTVDLGNGGSLTGRADDYGDASTEHLNFYNPAFSSNIIQGGEVTLTMGDKSQWNVQGQSWITNLKANGNVTIDLTNTENEYKNYNSNALTIRKLDGNANIKMNLNGDRSLSDMLYIGQGKGEYNIELANLVKVSDMYAEGTNSSGETFEFSGLRFATVGMGSDVKFNVTAKGQGFNNVRYTVGTDEYNSTISEHENDAYNGGNDTTLEKPGNDAVEDILKDVEQAQNQANQIMLLAEETEPANDNATQHLNYKLIAMESDGFTDAGKTVLNMSRANYSNAIYMDRLNKRLGEARYINDDPEEDEGMWVRIRHDRIGKEDAFRSQNTMYELGYDKRQECDNGKRRVGFAVDYMHGDTGYSDIAGKGEIDRYGLWLYDTWTGNKGHYADYVAKWGHLQNEFEVYTMTGGEKVTGDYSNNVFSISAEYGRKKDMGNDWYIEPQAQLQLARVTGADYTTSQGTKVSVDGINSLIGRAGFRIGKDFGEEKQSTLYFKADVLHEFLGDQTIRALDGTTNGWQTVDYENQGTWYDIGIGYAAMLSQSTYAFVDLEQSFGNDNDDTYQINAGVRWTF